MSFASHKSPATIFKRKRFPLQLLADLFLQHDFKHWGLTLDEALRGIPPFSTQAVAKQPRSIFVAHPYSLYPMTDYRQIFRDVGKAMEVRFEFADERISNVYVLQKIITMIRATSFGIYDISGWNANVTLELGLAYGMSEKAYVSFNPTHTKIEDVPADLRGLERLQYGSFTEYRGKLEELVSLMLPITRNVGAESQLDQLRDQITTIMHADEPLSIKDIASALGISVDLAKVVVRPLVDAGSLSPSGVRRGTKYTLAATP